MCRFFAGKKLINNELPLYCSTRPSPLCRNLIAAVLVVDVRRAAVGYVV